MDTPPTRTLALLAKQPRPGAVKSRLAADTSPEWAAAVAAAFLRDLLERLAAVAARRVLAYAPHTPDARADFAAWAGPRWELTPQVEGDLGRRMAALVSEAFAAGAGTVVLVGADSPTLPVEFIERAFHALEAGAEVVVGPAADGGYYLLGCAGRVPPVFDGVAWGGPRVLLDTVARLEAAGVPLAVLPPWYDVDTLADWWALRGHLAALRQAGQAPALPHTLAVPPVP